jgi:hypothetical protein
MTTTKHADLNETARREIDRAEERTLFTLQAFRDEVAAENSSPTYLINANAEQQFEAEFMLRWLKGVRYSISEKGDGLEDLLRELDRSCDSWTPTNSTSLLARLQGDIELRAMRSARKLVLQIFKANESDPRPAARAKALGYSSLDDALNALADLEQA